jgi:hypothetical protein
VTKHARVGDDARGERLTGEEIGKALRWALETLADDLRWRSEAAGKQ